MKTIEEIAKQTIDKHIKIPVGDISTKYETMYISTAIQACADSIIESQRWIPISEELPIDKQEIIAKNDEYKETFIFFENGVGDSEYIKRYFTHWRPIELN